jgi:hypothetical protein
MSSQKNQPLPNPFDTAINTGKIGGQGKQETDNTANQQSVNTSNQQIDNTTISKTLKEEKSQSVDTKNQQTVKTAKKKPTLAGEKQPRSKVQTPPPAPEPEPEEPATDEEDKTKLTCLIPTDLFIKVKIYAAKRKKAKETMTNITIKALEEYLTNHPN